MRWTHRGLNRRASIVLAGFLALAGPAVPAFAEDAKPADQPAAEQPAATDQPTSDQPAADQRATDQPAAEATSRTVQATLPQFELSIPTITAVGSSIDEATLRAILSGSLVDHADELAVLRARSIRIPELTVTYSLPPIEGETTSGSTTFHDILIRSVSKGVAQSVSVASADSKESGGSSVKLGSMSAENFDIGGLLAFYGLVKGDPTAPRKTIYRNFVSEGGTITAQKASCTIGRITAAGFKARPLKVSLVDFIALAQRMDTSDEEVPAPEDVAKFVAFYVDVIDALEVSPVNFAGFSCSGTDEDNKAIAFGVDQIKVGAFANGRYPDVTAKNIKIGVDKDGAIALASFVFKGLDFSGPLAALKAAGDKVDPAWFEANYRQLIPGFGGIAFNKLTVDVPDENGTGRFKGSVDRFDFSLKDFINGIPTDLSTLASHVVVEVPKVSEDSSIKKLIDLGIKTIDIGFEVAINWDKASNEIRVRKFSITGVNLGTIAAASVIGNATADLFDLDNAKAMAAGLAVTLKRASVDIKDAGLAAIVLREAAKEAGQAEEPFRKAMAALTQGTILLFLGGAANATEVSDAVAKFLNGAKSLSITVTAKDPAGVSFDDLTALKDDPSALLSKVTIDAVAR